MWKTRRVPFQSAGASSSMREKINKALAGALEESTSKVLLKSGASSVKYSTREAQIIHQFKNEENSYKLLDPLTEPALFLLLVMQLLEKARALLDVELKTDNLVQAQELKEKNRLRRLKSYNSVKQACGIQPGRVFNQVFSQDLLNAHLDDLNAGLYRKVWRAIAARFNGLQGGSSNFLALINEINAYIYCTEVSLDDNVQYLNRLFTLAGYAPELRMVCLLNAILRNPKVHGELRDTAKAHKHMPDSDYAKLVQALQTTFSILLNNNEITIKSVVVGVVAVAGVVFGVGHPLVVGVVVVAEMMAEGVAQSASSSKPATTITATSTVTLMTSAGICTHALSADPRRMARGTTISLCVLQRSKGAIRNYRPRDGVVQLGDKSKELRVEGTGTLRNNLYYLDSKYYGSMMDIRADPEGEDDEFQGHYAALVKRLSSTGLGFNELELLHQRWAHANEQNIKLAVRSGKVDGCGCEWD
ncbi:hypothetical protein B484DRAFT_400878 [Ochromonadaceae sp. CCMP2298]|nr:hypothetical protein B484DRAFT_400878 [Ochromonadaceae sp. CCMP2298]